MEIKGTQRLAVVKLIVTILSGGLIIIISSAFAHAKKITFTDIKLINREDAGFNINVDISNDNILILFNQIKENQLLLGILPTESISSGNYDALKSNLSLNVIADLSDVNGVPFLSDMVVIGNKVYIIFAESKKREFVMIMGEIYNNKIIIDQSSKYQMPALDDLQFGLYFTSSVLNNNPVVTLLEKRNYAYIYDYNSGNKISKIFKLNGISDISFDINATIFNIGNKSAILYTDKDYETLKIAVTNQGDVLTEDSWDIFTIDPTPGVGISRNPIVRGGYVYIAYLDYLRKWIKFARNLKPYELDEWIVEVVDWDGFLCYTANIALTSDRIWIVYHDLENDQVKLATRPLSVKYGGWQVVPVTTDGVGAYSDIVVVNDQPLIFYSEFSSKRAKEGIKGIRLAIPVIKESDEDEVEVETGKR